jgi:tetratricopeptide (TPR) repeat protein
MKKIIFFLLIAASTKMALAQPKSAEEMYGTAQAFMKQGDFGTAINVLELCLKDSPTNEDYLADMGLCLFNVKNYDKALEYFTPLMDKKTKNERVYLVAAGIYMQRNDASKAEAVYKKGIKASPKSGLLYHQMGELLIARQKKNAIKYWEQGIENDPSYSKNYQNAARYYFYNKNLVWSTIYAEIFLNMEPRNADAKEMKQYIYYNYKNMFQLQNAAEINFEKNAFSGAFLYKLMRQIGAAANGINVESLAMVRTRFIIEWFADKNVPAFKLFEYQQQLLKDGVFDAYNQWIFGSFENQEKYKNWTQANSTEHQALLKYLANHTLKIPEGQYYR